MTYSITYFADDASMGDTKPEDCDLYREWALDEIVKAYPQHVVEVTAKPSLKQTTTDDDANEADIIDFCDRLWDRCPWTWVD